MKFLSLRLVEAGQGSAELVGPTYRKKILKEFRLHLIPRGDPNRFQCLKPMLDFIIKGKREYGHSQSFVSEVLNFDGRANLKEFRLGACKGPRYSGHNTMATFG